MNLDRAIDRYLGELARAGRQRSTRFSYERYLFKLAAQVERSRPDATVRDVTTDDCRAFLDKLGERVPVDGVLDSQCTQRLLRVAPSRK